MVQYGYYYCILYTGTVLLCNKTNSILLRPLLLNYSYYYDILCTLHHFATIIGRVSS